MGKSFKRLEVKKRFQLKELLDKGIPKAQIAETLGVHIATVYREIQRGIVDGEYQPENAQERAERMSIGVGRKPIIEPGNDVATFIANQILDQHKSVGQTVVALKDELGITISRSAIYNAINNGLIPGVTIEKIQTLNTATVFSNGHIILPRWYRSKFGIADGDQMMIEVSDDGAITFKKINDHMI